MKFWSRKQLVRAWSVGGTGRLLNTYPLLPTYVWFKTKWTTNILYKLWWLEQIIWNKYSPVWINFYWILLIKDYLLRTVLFQLYRVIIIIWNGLKIKKGIVQKYMSDEAVLFPKWSPDRTIILEKHQLGHSYTFWTRYAYFDHLS